MGDVLVVKIQSEVGQKEGLGGAQCPLPVSSQQQVHSGEEGDG